MLENWVSFFKCKGKGNTLIRAFTILVVNHLAAQLAERLGGQAYQLHAPAFVETREHRDVLLSVGPIKEILDIGFEFVDYSDLHYRADDELRYEVGRRSVTGNTDRLVMLRIGGTTRPSPRFGVRRTRAPSLHGAPARSR